MKEAEMRKRIYGRNTERHQVTQDEMFDNMVEIFIALLADDASESDLDPIEDI